MAMKILKRYWEVMDSALMGMGTKMAKIQARPNIIAKKKATTASFLYSLLQLTSPVFFLFNSCFDSDIIMTK